ncbi:hypothetical protein [uncultured Hymenobacter sp.]|uniref:hypothetical protein n=1 Tax=uncultured Hymenobacter sp. TaxID=170016 RepID=UPI0035CAC062
MFTSLFLIGNPGSAELLLLFFLFTGLSVSLLRGLLWTERSAGMVPPSTAYLAANEVGNWPGLPEQEIATIAEYKAQKHRLLRN